MRDLVATRLSHYTDASTSIERQRESGIARSKSDGCAHPLITEDIDVSGAVSPFDRPELGPYLTDPAKIAQWDRLVVTKLDRLSRSLIDLDAVVRWCDAHNKVLISIGESIDMSTAAGRMFVMMSGIFAQFERERMSERRTEAAVKIRSNGHYGGGQAVPFGYRAVKVNSHYELHLDPMAAAVITEFARLISTGNSLRSACKIMNANGYPTAKGRSWDAATLGDMLRNPSLRGYVMHDGQPVRGDDGLPVTREAILEDDVWAKLQAALERLSQRRSGIRHDGALLLRVLYHGSNPLYIHRRMPGKDDRYRTGPKVEKSASFDATTCEEMLEDALMSKLGTLPMRKLEITPAEDHTRDLQAAGQAIAEIETLVVNGSMPAASGARMLAQLEAKRDALAQLPSKPEVQTYEPTGQTFAQFWSGLDQQQRHTFLIDNKVSAQISRGTVPDADHVHHLATVYDAKLKYTMQVQFSHVATLLGK